MDGAKSFSRRYILGSSTAIVTAGAFIAASPATLAKKGGPEDLAAANVESEAHGSAEIEEISKKLKGLKKGKEARNAATLRDYDNNPFLKPKLVPLSNEEQNHYKRKIEASGSGI